jgi:beta-glucanase (GH16 family)
VSGRVALLAAALALAGACTPPSPGQIREDPHGPVTWTPGTWTIVWQDEFEGPAGTAPDPTKWAHETGNWGWGNHELQDYTDSTNNAALDGEGHLVITARAEPSNGSDYTSARLTTKGLFERTYGRFEARMRLPRGRGMWPAFWILGNDIDQVGWPKCGEMDIMEENGSLPTAVSSSLHGSVQTDNVDFADTQWQEVPGGADVDFHVYAVEWDPANIVFLVDDHAYFQLNHARRPIWDYDHPFFILVNLAVGGLFPGPPDATTVFPQTLAVDYVRVSVRGGNGDAGVDASVDTGDDATPAADAPDAGADETAEAGPVDAPAAEAPAD